jgi:putative transposase
MAMGRPKATLVLHPEQREQLEGLASSRSLPAELVGRAKIILLSASGKTNMQIARHLGLTKCHGRQVAAALPRTRCARAT